MLLLVVFLFGTVLASSSKFSYEEQSEEIPLPQDSLMENQMKESIISNNYSVEVPFIGSTITLDTKNLYNDKLDLKLKFGSSDDEVEARKKSKIKKVFVPILVFILLKAMVLIPLALGILGIKTWNAIQLSFVSFVSALALAIWKLCSKLNHEHAPTIIHNAWDPYHHDRSDFQHMAFSNSAQPQMR